MRWAILSLWTESNTFNPLSTTLEDFMNDGILQGESILSYFPDKNLEIAGFLEGAATEGAEVVPILSARTTPGGTTTQEAYEYFRKIILRGIQEAGTLNGILLAFHGAMVAEGHDDVEGDLLEEIRRLVGQKIYLVCTLDIHANMTRKMVQMADTFVPYKTCPHMDIAEVGRRAAGILARMIREEIQPTLAMAKPRMIMRGAIASPGPERKEQPLPQLIFMGEEMERLPGVVNVAVTVGQAPVDIEEMGPSVVVVTHNDPELARRLADELGDKMWQKRDQFLTMPFAFKPIQEAIQQARSIEGGPVLLVEYADSPTAGTPGDCVDLLKALVESNVGPVAYAAITDAESVDRLIKSGVGNQVTIPLGGRYGAPESQPLMIAGKVRAITDGVYVHKGKSFTGMHVNMGRSVVLESDRVKAVINERRSACIDPEIFRSMGIEPTEQKIVAVKCIWHVLANYADMAKDVIYVDTPGWSSVHSSLYPYKKLRRPMFPLDPIG